MNERLEIRPDGLTLGGAPFYLASGDMHYFRFRRAGWRRRLTLMKDFGLTAVQTYVPWDLHEPEKGRFCFDDALDLAAFLRLCGEIGLKVMLRPSVYMCSEWDFGGLPYWLMREDCAVRSSDPAFIAHMQSYTRRLCQEFVPYLSTNGGPVIAVALENEYGSHGTDLEYLRITRQTLIDCGVDVPFFSANGSDIFKLTNGNLPDVWAGSDFKGDCTGELARMNAYQPQFPRYAAEFWAGCAQQWGGFFSRQSPESVADAYRKALESGIYVNFYMFCGGTNFGFQNGALESTYRIDKPGAPDRYIPYATSYDVDALVSESGQPTEKYYACKRVLAEYLHRPVDDSRITVPAQTTAPIALTETAPLLDQADALSTHTVASALPRTMESMGQAYGFLLYTTTLPHYDDRRYELDLHDVHDRALVFGNGAYLSTVMRDRPGAPIAFRIPPEGIRIDILVENLGRINYGYAMQYDRKGLLGAVRLRIQNPDGSYIWNYALVQNWENRSLPLTDLSALRFSTAPAAPQHPCFFRGAFAAQPGVDTFLDLHSGHKGCAWINGFPLGRYWSVGPQQTLYVPGDLLREQNELIVLELHPDGTPLTVQCIDHPILDSISHTIDLSEESGRA